MLTGIALLAGAVLFWMFVKQGRRSAAVIAFSAGGLATALFPAIGHNTMSSVYSASQIVQKIRPLLRPDTPFYSVSTFDHTLPFYLGRTVTMVSYKDELSIAIGWEPKDYLPDYASFAKAWEADAAPFAMFAPDDLEGFRKAFPVPMVEVARDVRRVIVTKPVNKPISEPVSKLPAKTP